jgi:hypothetical protein
MRAADTLIAAGLVVIALDLDFAGRASSATAVASPLSSWGLPGWPAVGAAGFTFAGTAVESRCKEIEYNLVNKVLLHHPILRR